MIKDLWDWAKYFNCHISEAIGKVKKAGGTFFGYDPEYGTELWEIKE